MSRDLRSQLADYGMHVRQGLPVVTSDEVMFRESIVVDGRDDRPAMSRPGFLAATAALFAVLLLGVLGFLGLTRTDVVGTEPVAPPSKLGVFEPIQGWIVYPTGRNLGAVDPDDPSSQRTIELPASAAGSSPLGWSADGSMLLLQNERIGNWHVMDRSGETPLHGPTSGCCLFVGTNTLSPDGSYLLRSVAGGIGIDGRRIVDPEQLEDLIGWRDAIWSPDGSEIAFVGEREDGMTVMVVGVDSGAIRELVEARTGYVRHLAWSPDGTEILMTASPEAADPNASPSINPLVRPMATSLILVAVDGSGRREIASGHYVAAAWSPDGSRIAALDYPSNRNITIMNRDGSGLHVLAEVEPSGPFTGIAWHPAP